MYWPEYSQGRKSRWGVVLLIGLFVGLLGFALRDGRWFYDPPPTRPSPVAATLPTPITMTGTPYIISPVSPGITPTASMAGEPAATEVRTITVAEPAPGFTLPDLISQQTLHALGGYRGRPVILNFWASWCVPCRREMPALQATVARYEADGVVLLGMNQTYVDDLGAARAFVEELGLTFPNTRDDTGAVGAEAYQIVGIPTTVFITRAGIVAQVQIGEMSLEQITNFTEQLIAGDDHVTTR